MKPTGLLQVLPACAQNVPRASGRPPAVGVRERPIGGGAVDASWVVAQRARGDAAARACSDSEARERLYDVLCGPFPSLAGRAVLSGQNFSAGSKAV